MRSQLSHENFLPTLNWQLYIQILTQENLNSTKFSSGVDYRLYRSCEISQII